MLAPSKQLVRRSSAIGDRLTAHYEYSPFGQQTKATGSYAGSNPFRFSSEYYDAETGLVYYNYRDYDAKSGRWLSRDPIGEAGGYNLYRMINNAPLNGLDELGNGPWKQIHGTNIHVRGPETHTPNALPHGHVQGYKRQIFPDGSQRPHGSSGKDKDIPSKILKEAIKFIFEGVSRLICPFIIPIPYFILDPNALKPDHVTFA